MGFPQKMDQLQAPSDVDASSKLMEKRLKPTNEFGKFWEVHLEKMHQDFFAGYVRSFLRSTTNKTCYTQVIRRSSMQSLTF